MVVIEYSDCWEDWGILVGISRNEKRRKGDVYNLIHPALKY